MAAGHQLQALRNHPNLQRFLIANARPTGRQLGVGSYGSVEELEVSGIVCAGKKIHDTLIEQGNFGAENIASRYVEECQLMSDLRHPHLVQFLGVCFLPNSTLPVLVMERLLTNLDDLLVHNPDIPLSLKRSILADVAKGLVYLHSRSPPVIHRDLTAKNVLLNAAMVAKITDLGNARIVNLEADELARTLSRMPGTTVYMPPEAFEATSKYGPSLDSFSFGHLSLFIITQVFPRTLLQYTYRDPENPGRRLGRTEVQRRDEYIELLHQQLGDQHPLVLLVKQCLDDEPLERPSAQELLQQLDGMRAQIRDPYHHLTRLDAIKMLMKKNMKNQGLRTQVELETSSQLIAKDAEISRLGEEMRRFQLEYSSQLTAKDAEISGLGEEMGRLQLEYASQLTAKDAQISGLGEEMGRLQLEYSSQLAAKDAEISGLDEQMGRLQADLEAREAQIQEMGAGAEWKEDVQQELYENTARAQPYQDATKSSGVHNFLEDLPSKPYVKQRSSSMASAVAFSPPYTDSDGPEESMYNDFYRHTDDVCYPYMSSSQQVATAVHRRRQDEQLQYMSVPTDLGPREDEIYDEPVQAELYEQVTPTQLPPVLPSKLYDVKKRSSSTTSAAAYSAPYTGPGGGGPEGEEAHVYEELPGVLPNAQLSSSKAAEKNTTAVDQSRQAKNVSEWAPGTEVIGKYDFSGSDAPDLPFKRGDILTIIRRSKYPNWYKAKRHDGREGLIPDSFVQEKHTATYTGPKRAVTLQSMPWFHGELNRKNAEKLLKPYRDGNFLVRQANNYEDYALCVSFKNKVNYYRIRRNDNNWVTVDDEQYFANLVKLVEHFQRDAGGLCCRLKYPVEKTSGNIEYTVSLQDFTERGWGIPRSSLQKNKLVRKGESKDVWLGEYQGQQVAITMMKDTKDKKIAQQFLAEAAIMTTLQHPNLVCLMGVCLDEPSVYMIVEYMAKGSLKDYLTSRGRAGISKRNQLDFARDVCKGMMYLESQNLVHRKLAGRNVLIGDDNTAKVSDFRLTRNVLSISTKERVKLLVKWTAPEAFRENKFSNKSDVWSYGILLWEIYSYGRTPYPKLSVIDVLPHVEQGNRLDAPDGCTEGIYQIMKDCWDKDASQRPNFILIENKLQFESICLSTCDDQSA